jgi:hypothetical protein
MRTEDLIKYGVAGGPVFASTVMTAPPLPLDFKLKCLELAILLLKSDSLGREYRVSHYTNVADDFYDWLTAKGADT